MEIQESKNWNRWMPFDRVVTIAIMSIVFVLLGIWSYPGLFPGVSTRLLIERLDLLPNTSPRGILWNSIVNLFAWAGDSTTTVRRLHLLGQICAALSAGIMYRAIFGMLLGMIFQDSSSRRMGVFLRLAAFSGALAPILSKPISLAAQSPHPAIFGVLMISICMLASVYYAETKRLVMLIIFAISAGIGCVESPAVALSLPFCIVFLYMVISNGVPEDDAADGTMRNLSFGSEFGRFQLSTATTWKVCISVFVVIAVTMSLIAAMNFENTQGAAVRNADRFLAGIAILIGDYFTEIRQFLPGGGWMLVMFGIIVPTFVTIIISPYIFSSIRCLWHSIMYAIIGFISVAQLIPINTGSLWIYLATPTLQVCACFFSSISLIFVIAFFLVTANEQFIKFFAEIKADPSGNAMLDGVEDWANFRTISYGILSTFIALVFFAGIFSGLANLRHVDDNEAIYTINEFARSFIDSIGERKWVISNSVFDNFIRMEARTRNKDISPLPFFPPQNDYERRAVAMRLSSEGDKSFFNIGTKTLITDWAEKSPDKINDTAVQTAPLAWEDTGYMLVPDGITLVPVKNGTTLDFDSIMEKNRTVWAKWRGRTAMCETENQNLQFVLKSIDTQISLIANECGVLCDRAGKKDFALEAYSMARFFDKNNLPARSNLAGISSSGVEVNDIENIKEEIRTLARGFGNVPFALIQNVYGRIVDDKLIDKMKVGEAIRTRSSIADSTIKAVLEKNQGKTKDAISTRCILASNFLMHGDLNAAQKEYEKILSEDPANTTAMFGMATVAAHSSGNPVDAKPWLEMMKSAGVNEKTIDVFLAVLCRECGDPETLRKVIAPYITEKEATQELWILWGWAAVMLDDDVEKSITYAHLKTQTSVSQLAIYEAERANDHKKMMDNYLQILARNPDNPVIQKSVLDKLLADGSTYEAYNISKQIIKDDFRYAPAHFAVGTYLLDHGNPSGATAHLLLALEFGEPTAPLLNNLAMAYCMDEDYETANKYAMQALEAMPDSIEIIDTAALININLSKFTVADNLINKALKLNPENLMILLRAGELEKASGKNTHATYIRLKPRVNEMSICQKKQWKSLR